MAFGWVSSDVFGVQAFWKPRVSCVLNYLSKRCPESLPFTIRHIIVCSIYSVYCGHLIINRRSTIGFQCIRAINVATLYIRVMAFSYYKGGGRGDAMYQFTIAYLCSFIPACLWQWARHIIMALYQSGTWTKQLYYSLRAMLRFVAFEVRLNMVSEQCVFRSVTPFVIHANMYLFARLIGTACGWQKKSAWS